MANPEGDLPISKELIYKAISKNYSDVYHRRVQDEMGFFRMKKDTIEELTPKEWLSPQIKLQLYYRKSYEYALINALEASKNKFWGNLLTFLTLVLSMATSILLLSSAKENSDDSGGGDTSESGGAVLSAMVTGITGINSFMRYNQKFEEHANSVAEFSKIQRNIVNDLQTKEEIHLAKSFDMNAKAFNAAKESMPTIPPERVAAYKDAEGHRLFRKINDESEVKESNLNIKGMSQLGIFVAPKSNRRKE
jgi:hypothetical protein